MEFGHRWNAMMGQLMDPVDAGEAARRHADREQYAVALATPTWQLVVTFAGAEEGPYASVQWLQPGGPSVPIQAWHFRPPESDERLFLGQMDIWHGLPPDATRFGAAEWYEMYEFRPDGVVWREAHRDGTVDRTGREGVPVADHWEAYPDFGDYASICRFERDRSPGPELVEAATLS